MARTHINFRTAAALILLGVLAVTFGSLGRWQLERAAQRDALADRIATGSAQPPLEITGATAATELIPWRQATAHGSWLHQYTVLIENRNHEARPGFWVATPLQLSAPSDNASSDDAAGTVLVLRGWLARDAVVQGVDNGVPQIAPGLAGQLSRTADRHRLTGELFPHVPRVFELWSWSDQGDTTLPQRLGDTRPQNPPMVPNLDLGDYAQATGLTLLPTVIAQTSPELAMVQDWPHPSSDGDTNRGYALQWFSFCAIAVGAWLWIALRVLRGKDGTSGKDGNGSRGNNGGNGGKGRT